jgi:hypothetical protein
VNRGFICRFFAAAALVALALPCRPAGAVGIRLECSTPDVLCTESGGGSPPEPSGDNEAEQQNTTSQENDDQLRSIPISAPGTDGYVFVPGSTVDTFGQFRFFRLGKVLFRPSGRATYWYESNFLNLPDQIKESDQAYLIEPTVEVFLPVGKNGIRFDYSPTYRNYQKFSVTHKVSHTINLDSLIELSPLISFAVRDHFLVSSLDPRELVVGGEVLFSDARFRRNDVGGQVDWALGERDTLSLTAGWNTVRFEKSPTLGEEPFYDYDQYRFGASLRRDVTQRTGIFVDGNYLRTQTDDPRQITDSRGFETVAGVSTFLTPLTSGQFSVGVRKENYPYARGQDFLGPVFRGALLKEFTENSRLGVAFSRTKNLSAFQLNSYYITNGVGVSYTQDLGPKVYFSISPEYQSNRYPRPLLPAAGVPPDMAGTEHRQDRLLNLIASVRFRVHQEVAVEVFVDLIRRYSNLPGYTFTNERIGIALLLGERGITRGRMFY